MLSYTFWQTRSYLLLLYIYNHPTVHQSTTLYRRRAAECIILYTNNNECVTLRQISPKFKVIEFRFFISIFDFNRNWQAAHCSIGYMTRGHVKSSTICIMPGNWTSIRNYDLTFSNNCFLQFITHQFARSFVYIIKYNNNETCS